MERRKIAENLGFLNKIFMEFNYKEEVHNLDQFYGEIYKSINKLKDQQDEQNPDDSEALDNVIDQLESIRSEYHRRLDHFDNDEKENKHYLSIKEKMEQRKVSNPKNLKYFESKLDNIFERHCPSISARPSLERKSLKARKRSNRERLSTKRNREIKGDKKSLVFLHDRNNSRGSISHISVNTHRSLRKKSTNKSNKPKSKAPLPPRLFTSRRTTSNSFFNDEKASRTRISTLRSHIGGKLSMGNLSLLRSNLESRKASIITNKQQEESKVLLQYEGRIHILKDTISLQNKLIGKLVRCMNIDKSKKAKLREYIKLRKENNTFDADLQLITKEPS